MQRSMDPSRLDRFVERYSGAFAALAMLGGVPLQPVPPAAPAPQPRIELPRQRRGEQSERSTEHG